MDVLLKDQTHLEGFISNQTVPRMAWDQRFFYLMTQWRQESKRHKKSTGQTSNLIITLRTAIMQDLFHLKSNGFNTEKSKTNICGISICSKVLNQ